VKTLKIGSAVGIACIVTRPGEELEYTIVHGSLV